MIQTTFMTCESYSHSILTLMRHLSISSVLQGGGSRDRSLHALTVRSSTPLAFHDVAGSKIRILPLKILIGQMLFS
jgi:hypothetical protein